MQPDNQWTCFSPISLGLLLHYTQASLHIRDGTILYLKETLIDLSLWWSHCLFRNLCSSRAGSCWGEETSIKPPFTDSYRRIVSIYKIAAVYCLDHTAQGFHQLQGNEERTTISLYQTHVVGLGFGYFKSYLSIIKYQNDCHVMHCCYDIKLNRLW